jgi:hypothetical protein
MEIVIIVAIAIAAIGWFIWKDRKFEESGSHPLDGATKPPEPWPFPTSRPPEGDNKQPEPESLPVMPTLTATLDVNKDGKVDLKDAVAVAEKVSTKVKKAADVNKDGKVDAEDAKVVVEAAKKTAKKTKAKAKQVTEKVKKTAKTAVAKAKSKKSK